MYQQKGSSFRVVFWKLGTMQHWIKKRFDPSILAHGIRCCIKSGKKMWRFHLESQKSPNEVKMASGCEWEWVAKCNEKLHTECLFRLFKEKGLQVKDLQCLRRNNDLLEQLGGNAVLSSSSLVKHKRIGCPHKSKENEPRPCYEAPCEWTTLNECLDSMLWSQAHVSNTGLFSPEAGS